MLQGVEPEVGEFGYFLAGAQTPKTPQASWPFSRAGGRARVVRRRAPQLLSLRIHGRVYRKQP